MLRILRHDLENLFYDEEIETSLSLNEMIQLASLNVALLRLPRGPAALPVVMQSLAEMLPEDPSDREAGELITDSDDES